MLYDEYIAYCQKYEKIYGEKTVVVMEVGSFFECYAVETDTQKEGAPMSEVCSLLHIQSTRKNKSIQEVSRTNPLMCGFPSASLSKFMTILIQNQYTVVVIEQVTPPPNPERKVTQICSPATYLEPTSIESRWLLTLYLSGGYDRMRRKPTTCIAMSMTDVTTGELFVVEEETYHDTHRLVQELNRFVTAYPPKEIIFITDKVDESVQASCLTWLSSMSSMSCCIHNHTAYSLASYQDITFQNTLLRKVYPDTGMLTPIEYIDMERHVNVMPSLVYLLYFVLQHNDQLVARLQKPKRINMSNHLRLTHTALDQLNITSPTSGSLLHLLNKCVTPMGKRWFVHCLVSPITNVDEIKRRQSWIHQWQIEAKYESVRKLLQPIKDLERLFRRILLETIQPCEMLQLCATLEQVQAVQQYMDTVGLSYQNEPELDTWLAFMTRWDMDVMRTCTLVSCTNFYKEHESITPLRKRVSDLENVFQEKVAQANQVAKDIDAFKLERTERGEYQITITKRRYDVYLATKKGPVFTAQPVSTNNKTMVKLYFEGMAEAQDQLHEAVKDERNAILEAYYNDVVSFQSYAPLVERITAWLAEVDVWSTSAYNADRLHYSCPDVVEGNTSSICATEVRHPLIEHIQKDIAYVPNDIILHGESSMLLHGINAVGKSSFMKSIGITIVMAQAGMFVPAKTCRLVPYTQLFTRLPCGDNLFKGHSTFVAEMLDIKSILQYSDRRTIVIGDEVCSGTETVSAIAIVASTLATLSTKQTSFIFATHLFEVSTLDLIRSIPTISVHHMSVSFDTNRKVLVYDRKVKPGPGNTLYGLEVCRSLELDAAFLVQAQSVRQSYLDEHVLPDKRSRYSSHLIMNECSVCHKQAVETHHIKEQHTANERGFLDDGNDHRHKHHPSNLMNVCSECHDRIHAEQLVVDGYQMTSRGVVLAVTEVSPSKEKEQKEEKTQKVETKQNKTQQKDDGYKHMIQAYLKVGKSITWIAKELGITTYKVKNALNERP